MTRAVVWLSAIVDPSVPSDFSHACYRYKDEPTKLVLLGKDYNPMEAMNVSYLIESQSLQIAVADSEKNIRLLQYSPYSKSA